MAGLRPLMIAGHNETVILYESTLHPIQKRPL